MKFSSVCLLTLSGIMSSGVIAETTKQPLTDLDLFQLEFASAPHFSPDGKSIIYTRNFMDIMTDKRRSDIWQMTSEGKNHRPLTSDKLNAGKAKFSPDGSKLAYVSNRDGSNHIYVRWMDNGDELKLTVLPYGASNLSWSPDGQWIAYTQFVPGYKKPYARMPAKPKGATWADSAVVVDEPIYRFDGVGHLPQGHTQIFVIPATGGSARQLTTDNYDHGSTLAWAKDGKSIVFSANRRENAYFEPRNSELYRIDVATKAISQLTKRFGPDKSPAISPNGKWIAWTGYDDKELGHQLDNIYLMKTDGGEIKNLTASLDRGIAGFEWRDDKNLYAMYHDKGDTKIAKITVNGKITELVDQVGGTSFGRPYSGGDFTVHPKGYIAYTHGTTDRLADIAVTNKRGKKSTILTDLNGDVLPYRELATVEEIWYKSSFDGQEIQGWIAKPANFDPSKKYPLILEIHGGPYTNYGFRFSPEVQLFAAAGYVVLYTNPRGSTSYGQAFADLIHHNYPGNDYDDLMSGVDEVIKQGYVDEERLYVTGGSGGGVLTSWIIGKTDRFAAAVVAKPVINWSSFALYADISFMVGRYWFGKNPWEDPEAFWARSPLSLVGNVKTPTMMLTGESDLRTPMSETEQYFQALKLRDIETKMVRIPGSSHSINKRPSNLISKVNHIIQWFDDHGTQDENSHEK